jgi:ABC-type Mn2+/Zn2+ transport system ATPase subunit
MGSLLVLSKASFGYGGEPVLTDVDLELRPGDFWGIAGPNGAGKTTLFRGMLGLIEPLAGSVERRTRAIGYVPQRESLDPLFPLRVDEVVAMGAHARLSPVLRRRRGGESERLRDALRAVDLEARAADRFSSLSGGQRQRALIARALLVQPDLLLLDEPTSGVDRATQRVILQLLARLSREERTAILLVTHDLGILAESVRTVVWVDGGRAVPRAVDAMRNGELRGLGSIVSPG